MADLGARWRAQAETAMAPTTPLTESAAIFSRLARDMASRADCGKLSSGLENTGHHVDATMSNIYLELFVRRAKVLKDRKQGREQDVRDQGFVRCIFLYCQLRVHHLLKEKQVTSRSISPVCWESLCQVMTHAIRTSMEREGGPTKALDRLYLSSGFLTTLEVVHRAAVERSIKSGVSRVEENKQEQEVCVKIVGVLSCSSLMVARKIVAHTDMSSADQLVCVSILGTILKFQRLLNLRIPNIKVATHQGVAEMFLCSMNNLLHMEQTLFLGPSTRARTRTRVVMELMVTQALLAGNKHGLGRLEGCFEGLSVSDQEKLAVYDGLLATRIFDLSTRLEIGVLEGENVEHSRCHNPRCFTFEGAMESMMKTSLCGKCRRVRYCSSGCQRDHFMEHRGTCV